MIYDCFLFFNELEILDIRLHELNSVIDKFVLVESAKTFTGRPKPYYFLENRDKFKEFLPKIEHIMIDLRPKGNWEREYEQRNAIMMGINKCNPDDTILISDVDEIPPASQVHPVTTGVRFSQYFFYYYLNTNHPQYRWIGTRMLPKRMIDQLGSIQKVRENGLQEEIIGGWHFGWMGGIERIKTKLESFSHSEYNIPAIRDNEHLMAAISSGKDILNRQDHYFVKFPIEQLPKYVIENQDKFKEFIKI